MTSSITAAELLRRLHHAGGNQLTFARYGATVAAIATGPGKQRTSQKTPGDLEVDGVELAVEAIESLRRAP